MPLFEYQCRECGHVMDVLVKSTSASRPTCRQCGSRRTEKRLCTFGIGRGNAGAGASCPSGTCPLS